jgi:hypothetical protein
MTMERKAMAYEELLYALIVVIIYGLALAAVWSLSWSSSSGR